MADGSSSTVRLTDAEIHPFGRRHGAATCCCRPARRRRLGTSGRDPARGLARYAAPSGAPTRRPSGSRSSPPCWAAWPATRSSRALERRPLAARGDGGRRRGAGRRRRARRRGGRRGPRRRAATGARPATRRRAGRDGDAGRRLPGTSSMADADARAARTVARACSAETTQPSSTLRRIATGNSRVELVRRDRRTDRGTWCGSNRAACSARRVPRSSSSCAAPTSWAARWRRCDGSSRRAPCSANRSS